MPLSIRGGGHQVAGSAVCDAGLVVDMSTMNAVHVDPVARTARVQAGATWADVNRTTQLFGLVTAGGEVSITGVTGLTVGGGMGVTQGAFGLACDNLRSIEIVTADGVVRTASRHDHPDLFWAARVGGRGLGVVTSFEFELHQLGPDVAAVQVAYAYADAEAGLRGWRDLALAAPDTVSPQAVLWALPADPSLPEQLRGAKILLVAAVYAGDPADAEAVLAPFRTLAAPTIDMSATMPDAAVQSAFDSMVPEGGRHYFKSQFMEDLTDDAIATVMTCDVTRPNNESLVAIRTLGGAIDRVGPDDSAYAHRDARFSLSVDGIWSDPADDEAVIGWVRHTWETMRRVANGGVDVDFVGFEGELDIPTQAVLDPNVAQLDKIRSDYDPHGLFSEGTARGSGQTVCPSMHTCRRISALASGSERRPPPGPTDITPAGDPCNQPRPRGES
jgi:FAD/FMN-containing dehydrogenase